MMKKGGENTLLFLTKTKFSIIFPSLPFLNLQTHPKAKPRLCVALLGCGKK